MAASSPVDESRLGEINRQSKIGNSGASLICPCDRLSENERVPLILGLIPTLIDECDPKAPSSEMLTSQAESAATAEPLRRLQRIVRQDLPAVIFLPQRLSITCYPLKRPGKNMRRKREARMNPSLRAWGNSGELLLGGSSQKGSSCSTANPPL